MRKVLSSALVAVAAITVLPGRATPSMPGTPELVNLEHVYTLQLPSGLAGNRGTDIEFFTSVVPLRDAEGQPVRDETGAPVLVEKDFAVIGGYGTGAQVVDISDPERPAPVHWIGCPQSQNDVQLKRFGTRWILALADDDGSLPLCLPVKPGLGARSHGGVSLFDVTDPWAPSALYSVGVARGAHNFTFHPTLPYGWVSNGDIPGGRSGIAVIDFSDLAAPTVSLTAQLVGGPHDVSFDPTGTRAYVAAENHARIYDSTDPKNPVLISASGVPTTYVHDATPSPDRSLMVATGESLTLGGFFAPGVCPGEGLTIYSIEGAREAAPLPVGEYIAGVAGPVPDDRACTAHVGRFTPNGRYYVMGWYIGGVRVVDLSDPRAPVEAGRAVLAGNEVWAAKPYKGPYIYTGDERRGFDVFRWTGPGSFTD